MRKKFCLIATAIAFLAMSAVSFAANTADINVTSEPITFHALCDKAGGVTLSFDDNTTFVAGDQITADLPLNVSLCNDIDYVIGLANAGGDPIPYTAANFSATLPVIGTDDAGPVTGNGTLTSAGAGVAFWVHGSKGSQRVFIDVVTDTNADGNLEVGLNAGNSLTFTADAGSDKPNLAINILDQKTYTSSSNIYTDNDLSVSLSSADTDYDQVAISAQNTLCINVSLYDNEYVKLSFDSKGDKYTWVPSDPQVAHVVAASVIAFAPCTKRVCGDILDPSAGSQGADDTCRVINNEGGIDSTGAGYAGISDGYCVGTHRNNRMIIQKTSGTPFVAGNFQVQLEILVDGVGGDQGAYFAGNIRTAAFSTAADACSYEEGTANQSTILYNAQNESNVYAIDSSGTNGDLAFGSDTDCGIDAENRITKVKTEEVALFNGTDEDFLWVDIPNIIWDRSLFTEGETLSVKVTLLKSPCGTIFTGEWCIGTLGCEEATDVCKEYTRVYPYFGRNGAYVNVFGITNTSASDVTYDVTIYEKDGDIFTASVPVGAHKINAVLLHSLAVTTADNTGGGVFGDAQSYVVVKGSMPFEGITYVTNAATGQSFSGSPSDATSTTVACP